MYWDSGNLTDIRLIETILSRQGNSLYATIKIPYDWLEDAVYPVYIDPTIDTDVSSSNEDAYEKVNDTEYTSTANWLLVGTHTNPTKAYQIEVIYKNITIPAGSTIDSAFWHPITDGTYTNDLTSGLLYLEDEDSANDFTAEADVINRTLTTANVSWSPSYNGSDVELTSPDIKDLIQEVIDRAGWSSGNNLGVVFLGVGGVATSSQSYYSYDAGGGFAPSLVINYTVSGSDNITTSNATAITHNQATGNGNIVSLASSNATEWGFQYGVTDFSSNVSDNGSRGTGVFSDNITGLSLYTNYQYRSYMITSNGTSYGNTVYFQTLPLTPLVSTSSNASWSFGETWILPFGTVDNTGGANMTDIGFRYGISGGFTDNKTQSGNFGTGTYSDNITGLIANTLYQFEFFGINPAGIDYGGIRYGRTLSSDNVTSILLPPDNFTLTDLGGIAISANWSASDNATSYLLLVNRYDYPNSVTGFEVAYSGNLTSVNLTGYDLFNIIYASLWSANSSSYSSSYSIANVGGDEMDSISHIVFVIPVLCLLVLSLIFNKSGLIHLTTFAVSMAVAFMAINGSWELIFFPILAGIGVISILLFAHSMLKGDWL